MYIPNTAEDQQAMLEFIGCSSVDDLFEDIEERLRLRLGELVLPERLEEPQLFSHARALSLENISLLDSGCFIGAGAYHHYIPSVVWHLAGQSGFYTAYTPYQSEASQGTLQAIYEFQTTICELTGMEIANASMYDGASALAESLIMASSINRRRTKFLVAGTIHPDYRAVLQTYARARGFTLDHFGYDDSIGCCDLEALGKAVNDQTIAVLVQNPNFFGCIEDLEAIISIAHDVGALAVVNIAEPTSLGLLEPPGAFGADIVVGEGQGFGSPLSFGGPYVGFMATKQRYVRNIPGRLSGATIDSDGKRGYVLALQAREQHIRRERAASNICTNNALNALAATIHLALLGPKGLQELADMNARLSWYLRKRLTEVPGVTVRFTGPVYNEFTLRLPEDCDTEQLVTTLLAEGIMAGVPLVRHYPECNDCLLIAVTELCSLEMIDRYASVLQKYLSSSDNDTEPGIEANPEGV